MGDVLASEEVTDEPSDFGALRPGMRLGRYELLVPIARGGMARVWAARLHGQRGFQKLVAIKTILPQLANEPEFERMFLDEARIASGVHHPNVCEIYELGEENRVLYLAMEWVSGDSFSRVLRVSGKTEAIDPRIAARVVADACAGLHSAHELRDDVGRELGVVHRDLSPHNILVTADGVAKVADFGVAKALGQLHEATSAGQLKGKIAYMSPEQISGSGVDRRSDLFSLGCVLYEASTGERPFKGDNDAQVMHSVLRGEIVPPSAIIRGYPSELEQLVLRALSPDPSARFPTAEAMRFALEELLARGPLVTQSNVAQIVRVRIGDHLEKRKERIRKASTVGDQGSFDGGGQSHRELQPDAHRSGVKQARPMQATLPLGSESGGQAFAPPYSYPSAHGGQTPSPVGAYTPSPYSPSSPSSPSAAHAMSMAAAMDATRVHEYSHSGLGAGAIGGSGPAGSHPFGAAQPSYPRMPDAGERSDPGNRQYVLAAGIGVLFAFMIGTGSFLIWKSQTARSEAAAAAASASAKASSSSSAAGVSAPVSEIVFRLTPADARISMNGRELAAGTHAVPRPSPGTTVPLVVRAPGHEDATVLIDASTVTPLDVTLKPHAAAPVADPIPAPTAPPPTAAATATATATATAADPPKPKEETPAPKPRPKPKSDPSLPPNPF